MYLTMAECGLISKKAVRLMTDKRTNRNNMIRDMKEQGIIKEVSFKIHYWYRHKVNDKAVSEKRIKVEKAYRLENIEQNYDELKKYLTDAQIERAKETRAETMSGKENINKRLMVQSEIQVFILNASTEMDILENVIDYIPAVGIKKYAKTKAEDITVLSINQARAYGVFYVDDAAKVIYFNGQADYQKISRTVEREFYKAAYSYKGIEEPKTKEKIVLIQDNEIVIDMIRRTWTMTFGNGISSTHNAILEDVYDVAHVLPLTKEGSILFAMLLNKDYTIMIDELMEDIKGKDTKNKHYNYLTADAHVLYEAMRESEQIQKAFASEVKTSRKHIVHCFSFMADAIREAVPKCEVVEYNLGTMLMEIV